MMRKALVICGFLAMLAGCAQRPDEITATPTSDLQYRSLACPQLRGEYDRINAELFRLGRAQHDKAEQDAFGVFMVGVPVGSMSGGDYKPQIATMKGQLQAIAAVSGAKNCPPLPQMASQLEFQNIPKNQ